MIQETFINWRFSIHFPSKKTMILEDPYTFTNIFFRIPGFLMTFRWNDHPQIYNQYGLYGFEVNFGDADLFIMRLDSQVGLNLVGSVGWGWDVWGRNVWLM